MSKFKNLVRLLQTEAQDGKIIFDSLDQSKINPADVVLIKKYSTASYDEIAQDANILEKCYDNIIKAYAADPILIQGPSLLFYAISMDDTEIVSDLLKACSIAELTKILFTNGCPIALDLARSNLMMTRLINDGYATFYSDKASFNTFLAENLTAFLAHGVSRSQDISVDTTVVRCLITSLSDLLKDENTPAPAKEKCKQAIQSGLAIFLRRIYPSAATDFQDKNTVFAFISACNESNITLSDRFKSVIEVVLPGDNIKFLTKTT